MNATNTHPILQASKIQVQTLISTRRGLNHGTNAEILWASSKHAISHENIGSLSKDECDNNDKGEELDGSCPPCITTIAASASKREPIWATYAW